MKNNIKYLFTLSQVIFISAIMESSIARAADIQFNGFGSVYGGQATSIGTRPSYLTDQNTQFAPMTRFGLNVGSRLTDQIQAQAQMVADGSLIQNPLNYNNPSWPVFINWVFLTYSPIKNLDIKLGRQLFPAWLAAENVYVSYLQPYRIIPNNVYSMTSFKAFDGLSINYTLGLGASTKLTFGAFGGRGDISSFSASSPTLGSIANFDASNLIGGHVTAVGDGFKARVQASRYYTTGNIFAQGVLAPGTGINTGVIGTGAANVTTVTGGASFDKYNIVVWAEYGTAFSSDGTTSASSQFIKNINGGYLMAGYRFGDFLPRYTFVISDWSQSGITGATAKGTQHDIGLNYQLSSQAVVKADFDLYVSPDGTSPAQGATGSGNASAFTLGVDFLL